MKKYGKSRRILQTLPPEMILKKSNFPVQVRPRLKFICLEIEEVYDVRRCFGNGWKLVTHLRHFHDLNRAGYTRPIPVSEILRLSRGHTSD